MNREIGLAWKKGRYFGPTIQGLLMAIAEKFGKGAEFRTRRGNRKRLSADVGAVCDRAQFQLCGSCAIIDRVICDIVQPESHFMKSNTHPSEFSRLSRG
jgi:hypothetical protein